ncbi:hypothetical protein BU14_0234s0016 [Porphyra umbilicalis]|uniref:Uncharacterized protein n=1 Tax=Porphyra umbilicalis TaxID=2786 RepID=A0A1X6P3M5_PORUM|nr:hypothetical protein BU14_0234s0016 [Porphyra umbilicalis]|eukprot:OSX75489.1 hypothetical protein BU14_0234s0016 [Porphyra umbilicalis]
MTPMSPTRVGRKRSRVLRPAHSWPLTPPAHHPCCIHRPPPLCPSPSHSTASPRSPPSRPPTTRPPSAPPPATHSLSLLSSAAAVTFPATISDMGTFTSAATTPSAATRAAITSPPASSL